MLLISNSGVICPKSVKVSSNMEAWCTSPSLLPISVSHADAGSTTGFEFGSSMKSLQGNFVICVSSLVSAGELASSIWRPLPSSGSKDTGAADSNSWRKRRHSSTQLDGGEDGREAEQS
jgi:hypothetical protein